MRSIFLFIVLLFSYQGFTQCPFPVILNSSGGNCLGASLNVSTSCTLSQIIWYKDNVAIDTVRVVSPDGITVAGGNGMGPADNQMYDIGGMYIDSHNNIYLADRGNSRIQLWTPGASSGVTIAGGNGYGNAANQFNGCTGVWLDANGNMYVADQYNIRIQEFAPGATAGITVVGLAGQGSAANQLKNPLNVFGDAAGNIYISDAINDRIQRWAPGASSGVTVAGGHGTGSGANQLDGPLDTFVDSIANVYVADFRNNRIQKWAQGAVTGITVAGGNGLGNAPNQLYYPVAVYVDGSGNIYVADISNRIKKWAPGAINGVVVAGDTISGPGPNQLAGPSAVWVDPGGNIYVADELNFRVQKFGPPPPIKTTFTPATPGTYTAVVTDNAGCTVTTNAIVIDSIVTPAISVNSSAAVICSGMPVTFTAVPSNGGNPPVYQWQVNGVNVGADSPVYRNAGLANGDIVSCILTSNAVCTTSSTANSKNIPITVNATPEPSVDTTPSTAVVCSGQPINFKAAVTNGGIAPGYQWQVNGQNVGSGSDSFTSTTLTDGDTVSCTVTNPQTSCAPASSNNLTITVNPSPSIPPGQIFSLSQGQQITLNPAINGNISSYLWSPGAGLSDSTIADPLAVPLKTMAYDLHVVATDGCEADGSIVVKLYTTLRIPGGFTPNGDGKNDIFYVLGGPEGSRIADFSIFSRWGHRVFQANDAPPDDPSFGWNGNYQGHPCPTGTYVYTVTVKYADGRRESFQGTIVLVR